MSGDAGDTGCGTGPPPGGPPPGMSRAEQSLLGFFSACWIVVVAHFFGLLPLAAGPDLSLYTLYTVGAVLGWLAGNVWMARRRRLGPPRARGLLVLYLFGPPSLLYLLRALADPARQAAAPLVPLWAFCVYGVFFLVPVVFRPKPPPEPPSVGGPDEGREPGEGDGPGGDESGDRS